MLIGLSDAHCANFTCLHLHSPTSWVSVSSRLTTFVLMDSLWLAIKTKVVKREDTETQEVGE